MLVYIKSYLNQIPFFKKIANNNNIRTGLIVAKDLENILFELDEDSIIAIVGLPPRTNAIYDVDYDALNEVVNHILNLPAKDYTDDLYVPDFDEKIKFNGLSKIIARRLDSAAINYGDVEVYFENQGDFLRDDIKNRFKQLYNEAKNKISNEEENFADRRYMYILEKSMPRENKNSIQQAVECLLAFYFESCDIFEAPQNQKEV